MAKERKKIQNPIVINILRVFQGLLIGGGAILPGVSGGVLCVVFGIYQPMMAVLAHPKKNLPRYWRMFLPIVIGWILGFVVFAGLIKALFEKSETLAIILFIGLVAGTLPSLYREAGKYGRSNAGWAGMILGFVVLFGFLWWVQYSPAIEIEPSFGWYLFCGILWGFSTIVPGMTSSSVLISLGLFAPMVEGVSALNMAVIVPMISGILAVVITLSKAINALFQKYYTVAFHTVLGIVAASTAVIVPLDYPGALNMLLRIGVFAAGFVCAWAMEAFGPKVEE